MPKFDVFQETQVNGDVLSKSKVRVSGDNANQAAVAWVKMQGFTQKASEKDVRVLGRKTTLIDLKYVTPGGAEVGLVLIPVSDAKNQCDDCGSPREETNYRCYGQCEEWRQEASAIEDDVAEADELLEEVF